jgi:hypothetical protein
LEILSDEERRIHDKTEMKSHRSQITRETIGREEIKKAERP